MDSKARVLTVDDDAMVRGVLVQMLRQLGMDAGEAADGTTALQMIRDDRPDLILLDLRMPGMDGLDVLSVLVKENPELPVVVVSGEGTIEDAIEALRRGAWDFIVKPVYQSEVLQHTLDKALEKARLRAQNREYRKNLEETNVRLQSALKELREDQAAGKLLQFQLLPADNTKIGPLSFTRSLFPSQFLSGDFVDYFPLGPHHAAFYVADVSGHGAASAFVTAMLTTLVAKYREAFAAGRDDAVCDPQRFLSALDRDLIDIDIDKHITMFYGVIDTRSLQLNYANASLFPYPMLLKGPTATYLECPGRPLGLFGYGKHQAHEMPLPPRGRLLLFTDGVLEKISGDNLTQKKQALAAMALDSNRISNLWAPLGLDENAAQPDDVAILWIEWGQGDAQG